MHRVRPGRRDDVVRHLETGYSARFGDAGELARGLATLLGDASCVERLGRRGREVAEAEFAVELQVGGYAALYEEPGRGA